MQLKFFLSIIPPTATAQEKKVAVKNGRPIFYEPKAVKEAKKLLLQHLEMYRPKQPLEGPLELTVHWLFPRGKHSDGEWRVTRPDTDNLNKLLKDCMTQIGFWRDDAQVVREIIEKRWAEDSGIFIEIRLQQ